ncbi:hypothetical protein ACFP8W_11880, partial [Nocardioides hankookensis]
DAARAARDQGIAHAELAGSDWDKALIDQAIAAFAGTGVPFSANDLRPLLPDVRTSLMGSRFIAAAHHGVIQKLGGTTSTKKNTHFKPVGLWLGVPSTEEPTA